MPPRPQVQAALKRWLKEKCWTQRKLAQASEKAKEEVDKEGGITG